MSGGYTSRGFRIFAERDRPANEWLYGQPAKLTVVESSMAFRGAHVRVYEADESVQLNVTEARIVADALVEFVRAAEADELTEPASAEGETS